MRPLAGILWPLGKSRGVAAEPWYLAGGVSAANCVGAYQAKGAATLAASYSNLNNPGTFTLTPGTTDPTWNTATGWEFGSNKYLVGPVMSGNSANMSWIIRFSNLKNTEAAFGFQQSVLTQTIFTLSGNTFIRNGSTSGYSFAEAAPIGGVYACAGSAAYKDGVLLSSAVTTAIQTHTTPTWIGARNLAGGERYSTCTVVAIAFYNVALTLAQVQAITSASQAL